MLPPVGGGSGVTAVTRHGSGEVNRGAGDEGRRESFRFHAIILQCGWVEIGCPILKMNFFLLLLLFYFLFYFILFFIFEILFKSKREY